MVAKVRVIVSVAFLLQCLEAIGAQAVRLADLSPLSNWRWFCQLTPNAQAIEPGMIGRTAESTIILRRRPLIGRCPSKARAKPPGS